MCFYYNTKASYCVSLNFNVSENSSVAFDLEVSGRQRKVLIEKICSSAAEDIIYSLCEEAESRLDDEELEYVKDQCPGWDVVYDKVFDAISCYAQEERRKESFWRASCKDILRVARRKKACYSVRHRGRRGRPKQGRSRSSFVAASSHANSDSGDDDDGGSDDGDGGSGEGDCNRHSFRRPALANFGWGCAAVEFEQGKSIVSPTVRAQLQLHSGAGSCGRFFVPFSRQEVAA